jgi:hypothetical protein
MQLIQFSRQDLHERKTHTTAVDKHNKLRICDDDKARWLLRAPNKGPLVYFWLATEKSADGDRHHPVGMCRVYWTAEFKCRSTDRQALQGVWLRSEAYYHVWTQCQQIWIYYRRQGHQVMWCLWTYLVAKATIYQLDTFVSPQSEHSTLILTKQMKGCTSYTQAYRDEPKKPSLGKQSSSASQDIPRILWNPNAHYRIYKRPSFAPILGRIHAVHAQPSNLMKIHCNIVRPSTSTYWKWSLSFKFLPPKPRVHTRISHVPHASTISFLITLVIFYDSTNDEDNSSSPPLHSPS